MTGEAGIAGEEDDKAGSTANMNVGAVLQGVHGQKLTAAVVGVAKKVEDGVGSLLAAAAAPSQGAQ